MSDDKYKETLKFFGFCLVVYVIVDTTLTAGALTAFATIGASYLK